MTERAINARANELSQAIEQACRTRDPSALMRLMTRDAVWRDNDNVHVGRDEIWTALSDKWTNALHCTLQQDIVSSDETFIAMRFESEWQHSSHGRWYRTTGQTQITLDDQKLIATIESRHADTPISVNERHLTIPMTTTTNSA